MTGFLAGKVRSYEFWATVIKVIDGDTIDLLVDAGFFVGIQIRVRVKGIDAPEVTTPEGRAVRDLLRTTLPVGTPAFIRTTKVAGDKYGRWLAELTFDSIGELSAWMIAEGHAVPYDGGARPAP